MNLVVRNAGRLVTCDEALGDGPLGVIPNGAVVAAEGRITWVGPESHLGTAVPPDAVELDAGGRAVIPGLVECHTHLVFAGDRAPEFAARIRGEAYRAGGIMTTVQATRAASDQELRAIAQERLERFRSFGVTTVEAKSGYGLEPSQELRLLRIASELDGVVPTLLGAHIVPAEFAGRSDDYVDLVCTEMVPAAAGLAEFCDVWCEPTGAFTVEQSRRVLEAGVAAGMRAKVHADQLMRGGGALLAAAVGAVSADHGVTRHAAAALARADRCGRLAPGLDCDLVVLDTRSEIDLAYHYGVNLAATVVRGGVALT